MKVEFRTLDQFPNHRFGSDGSVWSRHNNRWGTTDKWKLLTGSINVSGYRVYSIPDISGKTLPRYGHRLILEAFYGMPPQPMQGCHCDGNPSNNAIENLRWDTPIENSADALRHGRRVSGEKAPHSKLSAAQVQEIRKRRTEGESLKELAAAFSVNQSCISKIANRVHWKEVHHAA